MEIRFFHVMYPLQKLQDLGYVLRGRILILPTLMAQLRGEMLQSVTSVVLQIYQETPNPIFQFSF